MSGKQVELEITDLAFNGKSVAYLDGKVVFLNGGLPGEKVLAEITRNKPRYNDARVIEITQKSDLRIPAICSHFDICGGCTWQDLVYRQQLLFKQKQVAECLKRLGGIDDLKFHSVVGAAELFYYRNKMEFSFQATGEEEFTLGLHHRGRFDEVFDLETCHLQEPIANKIVAWLRDFVKQEKIPVYDVINHTGYMRFVVIRAAKRTGQIMVNIVTNYGIHPSFQKLSRCMKDAFPEVSTLVHNQNGQKSNIAVGETERVLYGLGYIEEKLFGCRFRIRANSFFQTNSLQTETLYRVGFDMLDPQPEETVLDLYCGTGSIGILVSRYVKSVVGVEIVEDAVQAANENAAVNNIENISFHHGNVADFLKTDAANESPFDIIIIDPPRAGLHPKALKRIIKLNPPKILYISCNPASFARDVATFIEAGYRLPELKAVDMFPHTMHIEVVGVLYRS